MFDDIKKTVWVAADRLRGNLEACKYKRVVLGLSEINAIAPLLVRKR